MDEKKRWLDGEIEKMVRQRREVEELQEVRTTLVIIPSQHSSSFRTTLVIIPSQHSASFHHNTRHHSITTLGIIPSQHSSSFHHNTQHHSITTLGIIPSQLSASFHHNTRHHSITTLIIIPSQHSASFHQRPFFSPNNILCTKSIYAHQDWKQLHNKSIFIYCF